MTNPIKVLDHGYVLYEDHMGSDLTVVNRARTSFDKRSEWKVMSPGEYFLPPQLKPEDARLLKFLAKGSVGANGQRVPHWAPFSHPHIMLEVRAPLMVVRQWYKTAIASCYAEDVHSWSEMSRRYTTEELEFYTPEVWHKAPDNKKQGSGDPMGPEDQYWAKHTHRLLIEDATEQYGNAIHDGFAPEEIRLMLPAYALYTNFSWTFSLGTCLRWLNERLAPDAQGAIREYAEVVRGIVRPLFPESFEAHGL